LDSFIEPATASRPIEMRELLLRLIIRTALERARQGHGLLIVKVREIKAADETLMRIDSKGSFEETGRATITPEERLPVKT
jgi:hypothetical protein